MPTSQRPFYIQHLKHVRALASPVRAAVLDALEVIGPSTVVELADGLGYPPDGLYYHLAALERLGVIVRVNPAKKTAARFDVRGRPVTIRYQLDDRRHARAMGAVVATMLRSAGRGFHRAYAPGLAEVDGPYRNLRAGRRTGVADAQGFARTEPARRADSRPLRSWSAATPWRAPSRIHVRARTLPSSRPSPHGATPSEAQQTE